MKHILASLFIAFISLTAVAQETSETYVAPILPPVSAEKQAEFSTLFKAANVTEAEGAVIIVCYQESLVYQEDLKSHTEFTDEEKVLKAKVFAKSQNTKIKDLLGEERYTTFQNMKKSQNKSVAQIK